YLPIRMSRDSDPFRRSVGLLVRAAQPLENLDHRFHLRIVGVPIGASACSGGMWNGDIAARFQVWEQSRAIAFHAAELFVRDPERLRVAAGRDNIPMPAGISYGPLIAEKGNEPPGIIEQRSDLAVAPPVVVIVVQALSAAVIG